jgi:hypothetical protein
VVTTRRSDPITKDSTLRTNSSLLKMGDRSPLLTQASLIGPDGQLLLDDATLLALGIKKKKLKFDFLRESQKVLDVFKQRDTRKNVRRLKMELDTLSPASKRKSGGFSFSLAIKEVRKNIQEEEREELDERIRLGQCALPKDGAGRLFTEGEIKLKTLNQFLIKYKQKFESPVPSSLVQPQKEDMEVGLKAVMVDYDSFFNGKREPHQMQKALQESRMNLSNLKFLY